jgi:hypothetical protein
LNVAASILSLIFFGLTAGHADAGLSGHRDLNAINRATTTFVQAGKQLPAEPNRMPRPRRKPGVLLDDDDNDDESACRLSRSAAVVGPVVPLVTLRWTPLPPQETAANTAFLMRAPIPPPPKELEKDPHLLAPLKLHYLRWVVFDNDTRFM